MPLASRLALVCTATACIAASAVTGCATPAPTSAETTAENPYAKDRVTTGSNIPKKGQAVVVEGSALQDQLNRGAGGASGR